MRSIRRAALAASAILTCAALSSRAAVLQTVSADAATLGNAGTLVDGGTGVAGATVTTARAGSNGSGTSGAGRAYVVPFQLPALAAGQTIDSASFQVFLAATNGVGGLVGTYPNGTNAAFDADLYGLTPRATNAVQAGDYFQGALDPTGATLLQDNLITPFTTTPADATPVTTSAAGNTALIAYLNAAEANIATAPWVFLRINADADSSVGGTATNVAYNFYTFDEGTPTINGVATNVIPTLTYTVTPEPAALGLLCLAATGVLRRSRRR